VFHDRLLLLCSAAPICAQTQASQDTDADKKEPDKKLYRVGGGVTPPRATNDAADEARAFPYLEKAARQNFPKAQFAMGEFFASRKNDLVTAYVWYELAQRSRFKHSDRKMKELAEKMTPEQLLEARRRAENDPPI
jgi:hypothetical protein